MYLPLWFSMPLMFPVHPFSGMTRIVVWKLLTSKINANNNNNKFEGQWANPQLNVGNCHPKSSNIDTLPLYQILKY
jgi:Golgi nucleoside diphosphatase